MHYFNYERPKESRLELLPHFPLTDFYHLNFRHDFKEGVAYKVAQQSKKIPQMDEEDLQYSGKKRNYSLLNVREEENLNYNSDIEEGPLVQKHQRRRNLNSNAETVCFPPAGTVCFPLTDFYDLDFRDFKETAEAKEDGEGEDYSFLQETAAKRKTIGSKHQAVFIEE